MAAGGGEVLFDPGGHQRSRRLDERRGRGGAAGTRRVSFTQPDFCEVSGLTVRVEGVVDGKFLVKPQGRDGLVHFMDHVHVSSVRTNVADPTKSVSDDERAVTKDLKVVDNGDGTLTITVLATGNFVVYGGNGKAIARNPGQVRFQSSSTTRAHRGTRRTTWSSRTSASSRVRPVAATTSVRPPSAR
jgi:hypothetical protein